MKNNKKFVGYYRVSTKKQDGEMDAQKTAVKNYLRDKYPPEVSFTEVESGGKNGRHELAKALAYCKKHNAILVVAKLDRLSRDLEMIARLLKNIDFVCCDMPQANRATIGFMGVIAQWEREQISKRTKEALAEKKKKGVKLGWHNPKIKASLEKYWSKHKKKIKLKKTKLKVKNDKLKPPSKREIADKEVLPTIKTLRMQGFSYKRIALALNESGINTRQGKLWRKTSVIRVAKRNKL